MKVLMDGSERWLLLPNLCTNPLSSDNMANIMFSLHYSFVTKRGLKICADPEAKWVKAAIKNVDGRASTRKNMAETVPTGAQRSTSTAITLTG